MTTTLDEVSGGDSEQIAGALGKNVMASVAQSSPSQLNEIMKKARKEIEKIFPSPFTDLSNTECEAIISSAMQEVEIAGYMIAISDTARLFVHSAIIRAMQEWGDERYKRGYQQGVRDYSHKIKAEDTPS
jgi:hypothetical protein